MPAHPPDSDGSERAPVLPRRPVRPAVPAVAALLAGLLLCCGCQGPLPGLPGAGPARTLPPTIDRMVQTYGDLKGRPFQILADFETPEQGTLFRIEPAGQGGAVGISTVRARLETGVGALRALLTSPGQQVIAEDTPEARWGLHRNWADYRLLLVSVYAPRELGGLRISVRSGTDRPLTCRPPRMFLKSGWNLLRIDLAEIGEEVNLADVRELRFWCDPLDTPVELFLDDLVLVDNRREVLAPADRQPGDLYAGVQGREIVVGAMERFELVFARGQIRRWYDLGSDPGRTRNLVGRGFLGPVPTRVDPSAGQPAPAPDAAHQWSALGPIVESFQTVVEAHPLRVTVQGEWRFGTPDAPPGEAGPSHRWRYCIYADGRVFLEAAGQASAPDAPVSRVGLAFACDAALGFELRRPESASRPAGAQAYALFARPQRGLADLLVVPYQPCPASIMDQPEQSRIGVLFEVPADDGRFDFRAMVRVWPADVDSPVQADPLADDYLRPWPIEVDAGSLVRTDDGDVDNDGFSEARGTYVLQLSENVGRLRIDGRSRLRFSPVFKVVDVADRDVWVYADGRQIRDAQRTVENDLLFVLPGAITGETLIELIARAKDGPAGPP